MRTFLLIIFIFSCFINPAFAQDADEYIDYYNKGYNKLTEGEFQDSIELFNKSLIINPKFYEAYLGLGIAYRLSNRLNDSLNATRKSIELSPRYYKAYYNLGLIYEQQGNYKAAYDAYKIFFKNVSEAKDIPQLKDKIKELKEKLNE